jgi:hypothetical protein
MLMGLHGCAYFLGATWESEQQLKHAHLLLSKGEYETSLRASREVLEKSYTPLGDQALFQIAMIHAHPENPKADIRESIRCFQAIVLEFPDSGLKEEAGLWVLILTKILEMETKILDTEKEIRELQVNLSLSEKAGDESKKATKAALQDLGKTEALNVKLKEQAKDLQARIDQLQAQMESLKKIDLTIEKKKRESVIRQKN